MAIDTNSMNLVDWYQTSNDPLIKDITFSMIEAGSIYQDIPMVDTQSLKATGLRVLGNLPTPSFLPLNTSPTAKKGNATPYEESIYFIRDNVDVDDAFLKEPNLIVKPFEFQTKLYLRGLSYLLNSITINNDHVSGDANAPVGIRARLLDGFYNSGKKFGHPAECMVDAGGVDLSDTALATASTAAANTNKLIRFIQQALDSVDAKDGNGAVIYMNADLIRRIEHGLRATGAGGGFEITKDAFDRSVMMYRGAKIRDIGRNAPDAAGNQSSYIITSAETADGKSSTSSTYTSLYVVKYGKEDFAGLRNGNPSFSPPFRTPDYVIWRSTFNWGLGFWVPSNRSLSRVFDIKVA